MPEPNRATRWWDPTWRRLLFGSVALFVVVLIFMLGRIQAGADPGLKSVAKPAASQPTAPPSRQAAPPAGAGAGDGASRDDGFGDDRSGDDRGDDDGTTQSDAGGAGEPDRSVPPPQDPPTTQAS